MSSDQSNAKKRRLEEETDDRHIEAASVDHDDDYPSPCEFSQMSRSERKRHREKKRRNQVNAGFDDLKDLLLRIDPETSDRGDDINRVDLIGRAVMVMKRLQNDNEALRRQWTHQGSTGSIVNEDDDLVTMAVPYLVPKEHQYIPSPPLYHSNSHQAPPPQQHRHPEDPHHLHHQYHYPPQQQQQQHRGLLLHESSSAATASSSGQYRSRRTSHNQPYYHHHDGHPPDHPAYYDDGYPRWK